MHLDPVPYEGGGLLLREELRVRDHLLPCGQRYIGSTTRPLHERVREHVETGRGSAIHEHLVACGGGAAKTQVRILAREKDEVGTRLREAITIKRG